jgi:hypothetical protein
MIIFQNKVEQLFLKLKFLNLNNKISCVDISDYINDINNNLISNDKIHGVNNNCLNNNCVNNNNCVDNNSNNIINIIDKVILKLDKKIICKGQIKRKNNLIEFEF